MIDLSRTDVVFLSYDEPNADENFAWLKENLPRAKRVHGVAGFDAAHRRVGEVAETPHVVTIDADNSILDFAFFKHRMDVAASDRHCIFSFRARNAHNALEYGNGGVKIWPTSSLLTLRTHENSATTAAAVDFCWALPYYQADRLVSEVRVTATPQQAFRAGFREGVKLNMLDGVTAYEAQTGVSRAEALVSHVGSGNVERLRVWCSVGAHVENGEWAIFGARLGCVLTALEDFETDRVADYPWLERFWDEEVLPAYANPDTRERRSTELVEILNAKLDLGIADLDAAASRFLGSIYRPQRRYGLMQ